MRQYTPFEQESAVEEELRAQRSLQETIDNEDETDDQEPEPRRPLHYWDDLRESNIPSERRKDSAVIRVQDGNETVRLAHIASIQPYSEMHPDGSRTPADSLLYLDAAAFLGMHHFNQRSPEVLSFLPDLLSDCNIYMTMNLDDSLLQPVVASRKAIDAIMGRKGTVDDPLPVSLAGCFRSAVAQPLSVLAGVFNVPMVNGASTSSALDNKENSPTFIRTVPTNRLDAQATTIYLHSLGVKHFGVLFVRDAYGNEFNRDLTDAAAALNMTVVSAPYEDSSQTSIQSAMKKLKESELRYFFGVFTPAADVLKFIIRQGLDLGIMGNPGHLWLFSEASTALLESGFYQSTLDSSLESDREIATALNGQGMILLEIPENDIFDAVLKSMGEDSDLYNYYVSRHDAPEVFDGFRYQPHPFFYQKLSYDYAIALGIGLCNMQKDFPTGPEIVDAVKAIEFYGASGPVSFDNYTGTRTAESVKFKAVNLLVDAQKDSIQVEYINSAFISVSSGKVEVLEPFVYSQGMTEPPPALPPLTVDMNLMSQGVRAFGWCLAGLIVLLSIYFSAWTYRRRSWNIVQVAQPFFLILLCFGTVLMASAIIPMSFQEPTPERGLNIACMTVPWLFIMGFSTAFSSLFCKALRLNKVFRAAAAMRRVQVKIKDVIWPFVVLSVANFSMLLAWTIVAPLEWTRVNVSNFDQFGRSVESYGTCFALGFEHHDYSSKSYRARNGFLIALGIFNFLAVVFANYQGYLARRLPSDFNESLYLALSMAMVLEGFLIGVPVMFLGYDNPTVFYVVGSLLIAFLCLGILLPTFVSKMLIRRNSTLNKAEWRSALTSYAEADPRRSTFEKIPSYNRRDQSADIQRRDVRSCFDIPTHATRPVSERMVAKSEVEQTGRRPMNLPEKTTVAEIRARVEEKNKLTQQKAVRWEDDE